MDKIKTALQTDHPCWIAQGHASRRHRAHNNRAWSDHGIVANADLAQHKRMRAHMHPISNDRHALKCSPPPFSNRGSLRKVAVLANSAICINEDAAEMSDIKSRADRT